MQKLKNFLVTSIIGGVIVILPMAILFGVFSWVFNFVTHLIEPFTKALIKNTSLPSIVADIIVIVLILVVCFFIGVFVKTQFGRFIFAFIETRIFKIAPGYTLVKETVLQILGNKKSPFSSVALAQIFGNETLVTCFITDEHEDGSVSLFVPTGPNPTSGNIFHLRKELVHKVDVSVETAMRSIISCGAGSSELINKYKK